MRINRNFVLRKIYGHYLLVPIRRNEIIMDVISLNNTAGFVFENCIKDGNREDIIRNFTERFICDQSQITVINKYIDDLVEKGLLVEGE